MEEQLPEIQCPCEHCRRGETTYYVASTPRPARFTFSNATFSTSNSTTTYGFNASALRISYVPQTSSVPYLDTSKEDLPDEDF